MATRQAAPPKGANKPKPAPKPKPEPESRPTSKIADLDVDQRRDFEDWLREKERNQAAWEHKSREELEEEYLEELADSKKKGDKLKMNDGGCADNDPCGERKPKIDLEELADRVFVRLKFEARIERERIGWAG